jgi:NAD(P)-dependent dehydrogenase (short-subunit alcohol dehydrogenase family)
MNAFAERVTLITGAGSGLGRQLARDLANAGAAVAAVDLQPEPLAALAAELPGQTVTWAVADVTDRTALGSAVDRFEQELGPIDLLIANAGIGRETSGLAFRAADVEAQVRVNLLGVANSIDAVLPGMLARRRGHLVAISSLASYRGLPKMAGYCASKAGVNALMEGLRVELGPVGISVSTICPGWIRTPLTADLPVPQPFLLEVTDAARRIVRAIEQRRVFYAFPAPPTRRVRLLRWLPCGASDWLLRQMFSRASRKAAPDRAVPGRPS